jgi:hypothetical protein
MAPKTNGPIVGCTTPGATTNRHYVVVCLRQDDACLELVKFHLIPWNGRG